MKEHTITIDVVSDIACPWCYVGKHRLETAMKQWKGSQLKVNWHPFLLNPDIPQEGLDRTTYLINKFGTAVRKEAMDRIHTAGASEGIEFNFGEKWLAVDTLPLHQLMYVAGEEGFKGELKERFFHAYFTENLHLNQPEVLVAIMLEFGWDAKKTQEIIQDETIADTVKKEIAFFQSQGVTGVPFFIINNKYGINGAQTPDVFINALNQVMEKDFNSPTDGDHCDPSSEGDC